MTQKICRKCNLQMPASVWLEHRLQHQRNGSEAGWRPVRQQALDRDDWTCRRCGRRQVDLPEDVCLEVHHVSGNPFDNTLENLETVCSECHPREGRPTWWSEDVQPERQRPRTTAQEPVSRPPSPRPGTRLT